MDAPKKFLINKCNVYKTAFIFPSTKQSVSSLMLNKSKKYFSENLTAIAAFKHVNVS